MSMKDFQILSKLGEGAYSIVYKVRRVSDGGMYALKKVKLIKLSEKEKQNAVNEVRILASFMHPNIIAYKEAFFEDMSSSLCIVMEFADGGDLYGKIVELQKKGAFFSEKEIWHYFIQMVRGLKALHDQKILHRDLKSANVFMCKDGTVKLGDLNVSKVAKKGLLYTQTGTPYYASPEVWKDQPYDARSDIWSLGCVLYEVVTLKPPFRAQDMQGLYKKVLKGEYPAIPKHFSPELANILKALLQVKPHMRPTCDQILQMHAVNGHLGVTLKSGDVDNIIGSEGLIGTIKIPKNLQILAQNLPKANYSAPSYVKRSNSSEPNRILNAAKTRVRPESNSSRQNRPLSRESNPPISIEKRDPQVLKIARSTPSSRGGKIDNLYYNYGKEVLTNKSDKRSTPSSGLQNLKGTPQRENRLPDIAKKEEFHLPKIHTPSSQANPQQYMSSNHNHLLKYRNPLGPSSQHNYDYLHKPPSQSSQRSGSKVLQSGAVNSVLRKDTNPSHYSNGSIGSANRIKETYDRVDPTRHGYNLPETNLRLKQPESNSRSKQPQMSNANYLAQHYNRNPIHAPNAVAVGKPAGPVVMRPEWWG